MFLHHLFIIQIVMMLMHSNSGFISRSIKKCCHLSSKPRINAMRMSTSIDITTYNVLSSHLASPDYFSSCNPDDLYASNRLHRLKSMLSSKMKQKSIICLQEVSMTWTADLHTYFAKNGYYFISTLYGNKFNNYMGVGIAVPISSYDIIKVDLRRIADTISIKTPRSERPSKWSMFISSFMRLFRNDADKNSIDPWYHALDRKNQMVSMILRPKSSSSTEFAIGTYHMPCMFQLPAVMMIHSVLSARCLQAFAGSRPYIYCGDFNITPKSSMYKMLTTGSIDDTCPDIPPIVAGLSDKWKLEVKPMISAYVSKLGKEPDYTNHGKVRDDPAFIDCLDYIFLSSDDRWIVDDVKVLPSLEEGLRLGPLPIIDEPSDHLMLATSLTLKQ